MEYNGGATRRRWLRPPLALLSIIIMGLVSIVVLSFLSREDTYYVAKASLSSPQIIPPLTESSESNADARELRRQQRRRCEQLLMHNASLKPGRSLVLIVRRRSPGELMVIDDEDYENLTVEIQHPQFDVPFTLPSGQVRLYYSSGGTVWVSQCRGRFGTEAAGTLKLHQSWFGRVQAEVDITIQIRHAQDFREMESVRFHGSFSFKESDLPEAAKDPTGTTAQERNRVRS